MNAAPRVTPLEEQYTAGLLAGSFGLTLKQARDILSKSGNDRAAAVELARKVKGGERI